MTMTAQFIPFEDMTDAEKDEHLWRCHGDPHTISPDQWHDADHSRDGWSPDHTHDKQPRRAA